MDSHRHFVAGWFGGCAGILVGHPFDTVKSRLQTQGIAGTAVRYRSTFHCFSDIIKTEGIRGLYKGMASPLLGVAVINAIVFGIHGNCMRLFQGDSGKTPGYGASLIAGSAAGLVQSIISSPMELIKLRMQVQGIGQEKHRSLSKLFRGSSVAAASSSYYGPWEMTKLIYRQEGLFRGLFRGLVVTSVRDVLGFGTYFATYDGLCQLIAAGSRKPVDHLGPIALCVAGGLCGAIGWLLLYPIDVVKSRIQVDGAMGKREYTGIMDCFRKSYRAEGLMVFSKGLNSTLLRAFPLNAATFCTVTLILRYWQKWDPLD